MNQHLTRTRVQCSVGARAGRSAASGSPVYGGATGCGRLQAQGLATRLAVKRRTETRRTATRRTATRRTATRRTATRRTATRRKATRRTETRRTATRRT